MSERMRMYSDIPYTADGNVKGYTFGGGCHFLLQGIFSTKKSNPMQVLCIAGRLYQLSHQKTPPTPQKSYMHSYRVRHPL